MTYIPRRLNVYDMQAKVETTYGVDSAPSPATDGVYLQYDAEDVPEIIAEEIEYRGELGPNSVGLGPNRRVAFSGRGASFPAGMYFRGGGAAYSASVVPPNGFHAFMKAAGFTATVDTTAASEKWTYAVTADSTTPTSLTCYGWCAQSLGASTLERVKALGVLASLDIAGNDQKPPKFTFNAKGIFSGDPTEASFTASTLSFSPAPPLGTDFTFSFGSFSTAEVYSLGLKTNRDLSTKRVPLSASGGHLGYVAGHWNPILTVTVAQTLQATFDPYTKRGGTTAALLWQYGSTQYNRLKLNAPQAQLVDLRHGNIGKIRTWELDFLLTPSTPAATDFLNFVAD